MTKFAKAFAAARAGEWWEYKLVPLMAVFYATALFLDVPIAAVGPAALMLLAAIIPGAVFVSVINDLSDRADDRAAGKANRMEGRSRVEAAAWVWLPLCMGALIAWWWRANPPLLVAYLGAWIAFSLYSLPPFRLKARGLAGVLADGSGAHLFPSLIAALLVFAQTGVGPAAGWLAAIGIWAGAYGVRGILWHQLSDRDADHAASVRTFAQRRHPEQTVSIARWIVFPLEAAALAAILLMLHHPLPALMLTLHVILTILRVRWWQMAAVLVRPRPRYLLILHDYYDVLWPVSLLAASAWAHPVDGLVLILHLLAFPRRAREVLHDGYRLIRQTPANLPWLDQILRRIGRVLR